MIKFLGKRSIPCMFFYTRYHEAAQLIKQQLPSTTLHTPTQPLPPTSSQQTSHPPKSPPPPPSPPTDNKPSNTVLSGAPSPQTELWVPFPASLSAQLLQPRASSSTAANCPHVSEDSLLISPRLTQSRLVVLLWSAELLWRVEEDFWNILLWRENKQIYPTPRGRRDAFFYVME